MNSDATHRRSFRFRRASRLAGALAWTVLSACTGAGAQPLAAAAPGTSAVPAGPDLVALSSGAIVVTRPKEWADFESAFNLIDEKPSSLWETPRGVVAPQTIVIALAQKTILTDLAFDSGQTPSQFHGCSAKDVIVEVSDTSDHDGFRRIAEASLADRADNQRVHVAAPVPGRWVRLTIRDNHGSPDTIALNEFRAYGTQVTHTALPDVSGTYVADYTGPIHVKQEGTSISGCYDKREGVIEGGIEGRVIRFTWREYSDQPNRVDGPAVMVVTPDAKQLVSLWWEGTMTDTYGRLVTARRTSASIGSCAQWAGGVQGQLTKDLEAFGRARVYGINFDSDSDRIRDESKPTLDSIVAVLEANTQWRLSIEGHTDSTSTAAHNQALSERRARAVAAYLESAGIAAARLTTVGYGASRPVAGNDTPLGRAQNRRVELVRH